MKVIGVGIIGAGIWGRRLVAKYLDAEHNGHVRLVKVCDISVAALGELLLAHDTSSVGQDRLTLDIRDIMQNAEISAVHIATPCSTHSAFVRMALEAEKNVLVEKPISFRSLECQELIDLAAEKGLVIQEVDDARFNRAVRTAREIVKRGDIGLIQYARAQWTETAKSSDADVLFDLGPEPIGILEFLIGESPREVSGVSGSYRGSKHDELVHIFAQYPNGVFAHVELNGLHPRTIREVIIVGSQATLDVDCANQRLIQYSAGKITKVPITPTDTIPNEIHRFTGRIVQDDLVVDPITVKSIETLETIRSSLWTRVPRLNHTDLSQNINHDDADAPTLETAVGLLEIVHSGANKTPILNQGELNPDLVRRYFVMLEKIGLVDSDTKSNQEKTYILTTKGLQFLIDYYESQRLGEITDNTRRVLQAVGLGTF